MTKLNSLFLLILSFAALFQFSSCSDPETIIHNITTNEVTAKDRLDSANAQATRKYGINTKLILIFCKNVKENGSTDISVITALSTPDSIGAWLYVYSVPQDTSLRIYTPNPLPTANDCIELTSFFNVNSLIGLIQDTSARNIISGALNVILTSNIGITTPSANLVNSDISLNYANTSNPVIKFNANFTPDTSSLNGNVFFQTGTNKTLNMFLIPAAGTLNLPQYIQNLTGFPNDLWVVNYKKTNSINQQENLILGTVVESNQEMSIPPPPMGLTSKVINLSKYVVE